MFENCRLIQFFRVVEKFEGFFSFIVLGQLLASGVCIGLAMFHLTLVSFVCHNI